MHSLTLVACDYVFSLISFTAFCSNAQVDEELEFLRLERNTWLLLFTVYRDIHNSHSGVRSSPSLAIVMRCSHIYVHRNHFLSTRRLYRLRSQGVNRRRDRDLIPRVDLRNPRESALAILTRSITSCFASEQCLLIPPRSRLMPGWPDGRDCCGAARLASARH